MLILVLKYGQNLGASGGSAPWTTTRGLASGPHWFGAARQAAKTLNLAENLFILVVAPRQQKKKKKKKR